jgi:dihydroorotate dehydrogenase (NAD+) catalytic subunit
MTKPNLAVNVGPIRMRNQVMVASGTFGYGSEYAPLMDLNRLGALVVKGIRLEPHEGNPPPRLVEVFGGILNAIGLQGPGVDGFLKEYMPFLRGLHVPVIVNIWGRSEEEYGEVAARFDGQAGIAALEVNISCPNVKKGGITFSTDVRAAERVIRSVREATRLPVIPKLAPNVPDIASFAKAAEAAGADAVSLINTIPAMAIDIETRRPILANKVGGLSGPAIHPVAVKLVWEAARAVRIPVIGMGGIMGPEQAIEFLVAGATAVAVGTANFADPTTALRVIAGIEEYLVRHGMADVRELIGSVRD